MWQENLDGLCECECEVSENSVHTPQSEEIAQLLHEYQVEAAIIPLTTLVTKRAVVEAEDAELCFDVSTYGSHTDYEIGYEYKQPHDGFSVFQKLLSRVQLVYKKNYTSKIQRVLRAVEK